MAVRSVLQGGSNGPFSQGTCDPQPMAQECLDRVQASLCKDLQWVQSNMGTALSSPCVYMALVHLAVK